MSRASEFELSSDVGSLFDSPGDVSGSGSGEEATSPDGLQRLAMRLQSRMASSSDSDEREHNSSSQRLLGGGINDGDSFDESTSAQRARRRLISPSGSFRGSYSAQNFANNSDDNPEEGWDEEAEAAELDAAVYETFDTIDWPREESRDRATRTRLRAKANAQKGFFRRKMLQVFYASQAWILVSLVGIGTALVAAAIDVGVDWLGDTRFGYCREAWWINAGLCCSEFEGEGSGSDVYCDSWVPWSSVLGVSSLDPSAAFWTNYVLYIGLAMVFAGSAAMLVKAYSKWAAGSGIPETKTVLGGFVINGFTAPKTLLTKAVGLCLSVSSGLNLGKEGPLVHVGMCVADLMSRLFPKYGNNEGKKRELLSAACAAGVSVAFGAPIGGVLFSLEEASYYFPHKTLWRSFFAATVAAMTLMYLNPLKTGKLVLFEVRYLHGFETFELIPFTLIAIAGGMLGAFFTKMNVKMVRFRKTTWLKRFPVVEAMTVAAITAVVHYLNPYLRGGASEIIGQLVSECNPQEKHSPLCSLDPQQAGETASLLLLAALARLLLTIFTFGLRLPAGLFIPSLAIGAHLGRAVGIGMQQLQFANPEWSLFANCAEATQCITPGVYAMLGAAAMLAGVTRMTVSLVVIIFELTGELGVMIPIMFAVMVAKWVGDAFGIDGIYDEHILLNEYPFMDNKAEYRFTATASEVITNGKMCMIDVGAHARDGAEPAHALRHASKHEVVYGPHTVESLHNLVINHPYTGFPLVREGDLLVGFIAQRELKLALARAKAGEALGDRRGLGVKATTLCCFTSEELRAAQRAKRQSARHLGSDDSRKTVVVDLRQFVQRSPLTVSSATSMNFVFGLFKKLGLRHLCVADRGRVLGILTKKDVLQHIAVVIHNSPRKFIRREGAVVKTMFRATLPSSDGRSVRLGGSTDDVFKGNSDSSDEDLPVPSVSSDQPSLIEL